MSTNGDGNSRDYREQELHDSDVKSRAVRGVASLFLRQGVVRVLGFISMLVLARILTPEIFGVFAIAKFIVLFFEEVSGLGLATALIRKQDAVNDVELKTVFTMQQVMVLTFVIAIIVFASEIASFYDLSDDYELLIQVLGLALFLASLKTVPSIILQRQLHFDKLAISEIVEHLVYIVFAIGLALMGYGIWALIIALLLRGISGVILIYYIAWWKPAIGFDRAVAIETLRFGVPILLGSMAALANNAVVPLVVGGVLGVAAVGFINFARTILDAVVHQPLILVGKVQLRVFGRMQSDREKLTRLIDRSIYMGSAISFMFIAVMLSQAGLFIEFIVTEKWIPSLDLIYIMTIGYAFYVLLVPYLQVLKATGDAMSPLVSYLLRLGVHIALFVLLLDVAGLSAYAYALIAAIGVSMIYTLLKVRELVSLSIVSSIWPFIAASGIAGMVAYHVGVALDGFTGLIFGAVVCLLVYGIIVGLLSGRRFGKEFSNLIKAIAPGRERVVTFANKVEGLFARIDTGLMARG